MSETEFKHQAGSTGISQQLFFFTSYSESVVILTDLFQGNLATGATLYTVQYPVGCCSVLKHLHN